MTPLVKTETVISERQQLHPQAPADAATQFLKWACRLPKIRINEITAAGFGINAVVTLYLLLDSSHISRELKIKKQLET
jgi:hypothetical protein